MITILIIKRHPLITIDVSKTNKIRAKNKITIYNRLFHVKTSFLSTNLFFMKYGINNKVFNKYAIKNAAALPIAP